MNAFQQAKLFLVDTTALDKDALHIYVALIVFFGSCVIFRWKAWQWKPWLLVLLAATAGEALDLYGNAAYDGAADPAESVKDFLNTLLAPTVLMLAARYSRIFDGFRRPA